MSEPIWCNWTSRIPEAWDAERIATDLGYALINGQLDVETVEGVTLIEASGEGNYGLHDSDLEAVFDWHHEHRVPYIAHDETKYECKGEIRVFDGEVVLDGRYDDGAVLDEPTYDMIANGDSADFATIDDYFAKLSIRISELSIDHLSPLPPPDRDELEEDPT